MAGKRFWGKSPVHCIYPVGQKFHRNHSSSLRFRDKHIFCTLRRNSRWPPKVEGKNDFCKKMLSQSLYLTPFLKRVFAFYAKIQDWCHKWREKDFWEKSPVDTAGNLGVKNFVEIALARSVSEINAFLHFQH